MISYFLCKKLNSKQTLQVNGSNKTNKTAENHTQKNFRHDQAKISLWRLRYSPSPEKKKSKQNNNQTNWCVDQLIFGNARLPSNQLTDRSKVNKNSTKRFPLKITFTILFQGISTAATKKKLTYLYLICWKWWLAHHLTWSTGKLPSHDSSHK